MPTIKELAAYVGVSVSTVSLVLRGEAGERKISQATQEKVWRAAQELGYQPNIPPAACATTAKIRSLSSPSSGPGISAPRWSSAFCAAFRTES